MKKLNIGLKNPQALAQLVAALFLFVIISTEIVSVEITFVLLLMAMWYAVLGWTNINRT